MMNMENILLLKLNKKIFTENGRLIQNFSPCAIEKTISAEISFIFGDCLEVSKCIRMLVIGPSHPEEDRKSTGFRQE